MSLKILILGAGGIGGFLGGRLVQAGGRRHLPRAREAPARRGWAAHREPFGNASLEVQAKLQSEIGPGYDLVLATCKAYDLASAIESIRPAMSGRAAVLPLFNGFWASRAAQRAFRAREVMRGTARIQVTVTPEGVVCQLNDWQTFAGRHEL